MENVTFGNVNVMLTLKPLHKISSMISFIGKEMEKKKIAITLLVTFVKLSPSVVKKM